MTQAFQPSAFQDNAFQTGVYPGGSIQKQVLFHIYTEAGEVIRIWPDVASLPVYEWPINSGPGAMRVRLPRPWGAAGEPGEDGSLEDLRHGNIVKVYVVDRESGQGGRLVWQGTILYTRTNLEAQVFELDLLPKTSELVDYVINDEVSFHATDPTNMVRWLVDNNYLPGVTWDAANPLVGLTFDLAFGKGKVGQFLDLVRGLAGGKWFLRLNPDNSLTFDKWSPEVANHQLVIGRHVAASVQFERSSLEVKKRVFFYGDTGIVGSAQLPGYDPRATPLDVALSNPRVQDVATANRLASAYLEIVEAPSIATEFTVLDSSFDPDLGYDIERLKPGQTVALVNPAMVAETWRWDGAHSYGEADLYWGGSWAALVHLPYVIASVQYGFLSARVKLSSLPPLLPTELVSVADHVLLTAAR